MLQVAGENKKRFGWIFHNRRAKLFTHYENRPDLVLCPDWFCRYTIGVR